MHRHEIFFGAVYNVSETYRFPDNGTFDFPHPNTHGIYAFPSRAYFTSGQASAEIPVDAMMGILIAAKERLRMADLNCCSRVFI